jgi:predicted  nucleic acid-binding Zn-ribbon protein
VTTTIMTAIAPGELIDKITILRIKSERISDEAKLKNVRTELDILTATQKEHVPASDEMARLEAALKTVNEALWEIEDDIRDCERQGDFGEEFIRLARAVYVTNDTRAALKKEINLLLGSTIVEEKSYAEY